MSNEGENKTLTSTPSRSTVKKSTPSPSHPPSTYILKKTHAPPP